MLLWLSRLMNKKATIVDSARSIPVTLDARQHERSPQGGTNEIAISIAKFGSLEKKNLSVRSVDICPVGMGIEADVPLAPGFVWFRDGVGPHRGGIVVWSRVFEDYTCRAGIKFIPVTFGQETAQTAMQHHIPSCHASELVTCMLVDEVTRSEGES